MTILKSVAGEMAGFVYLPEAMAAICPAARDFSETIDATLFMAFWMEVADLPCFDMPWHPKQDLLYRAQAGAGAETGWDFSGRAVLSEAAKPADTRPATRRLVMLHLEMNFIDLLNIVSPLVVRHQLSQ